MLRLKKTQSLWQTTLMEDCHNRSVKLGAIDDEMERTFTWAPGGVKQPEAGALKLEEWNETTDRKIKK